MTEWVYAVEYYRFTHHIGWHRTVQPGLTTTEFGSFAEARQAVLKYKPKDARKLPVRVNQDAEARWADKTNEILIVKQYREVND